MTPEPACFFCSKPWVDNNPQCECSEKLWIHPREIEKLQARVKELEAIIQDVNAQIVGYDDYHTVEVGFIRAALLEAKP
jgi:hypothetical protein